MSAQKKVVLVLLFGLQAASACYFGGAQIVKTFGGSKVSISWYLFWEAFLAMNAWLLARSYRNQRNADTLTALGNCLVWVVMIGANLVVALIKASWDSTDTYTTIVVAVGSGGTFLLARRKGLPITDPLVKGGLAVFFKFVPQLVLGYKVALFGSTILFPATVYNGHATIAMRVGMIVYAIKQSKTSDRNLRWALISELANELSWLIVTGIWIYMR